ncbi:MAG: hypothetical protein II165_08735 [Bacteroidales bacterium]|nr:hypothetical protein [Bacteroidales bacterium]
MEKNTNARENEMRVKREYTTKDIFDIFAANGWGTYFLNKNFAAVVEAVEGSNGEFSYDELSRGLLSEDIPTKVMWLDRLVVAHRRIEARKDILRKIFG